MKKEIEELFSTICIRCDHSSRAESHVDRSIIDPLAFVKTNVMGTATLLNACQKILERNDIQENCFIMCQPMKYMVH